MFSPSFSTARKKYYEYKGRVNLTAESCCKTNGIGTHAFPFDDGRLSFALQRVANRTGAMPPSPRVKSGSNFFYPSQQNRSATHAKIVTQLIRQSDQADPTLDTHIAIKNPCSFVLATVWGFLHIDGCLYTSVTYRKEHNVSRERITECQ